MLMPNMTTKQSWEEKLEAELKMLCQHYFHKEMAQTAQRATDMNALFFEQFKRLLGAVDQLLAEERAKVFEEERRFILNVLDGIDVADYQMQNKGGGTNAIRFALASRVSPHHQ